MSNQALAALCFAPSTTSTAGRFCGSGRSGGLGRHTRPVGALAGKKHKKKQKRKQRARARKRVPVTPTVPIISAGEAHEVDQFETEGTYLSTVPTWAYSGTVEAYGARGSPVAAEPPASMGLLVAGPPVPAGPGQGTATFAVTPGEVLQVNVGGLGLVGGAASADVGGATHAAFSTPIPSPPRSAVIPGSPAAGGRGWGRQFWGRVRRCAAALSPWPHHPLAGGGGGGGAAGGGDGGGQPGGTGGRASNGGG